MVINKKNKEVICTFYGRGTKHDFALFKESNLTFNQALELLADSGYQGLQKLHENSNIPTKRPRNGKLTKEEKAANQKLSSRRVVVENVI